MDNYNEQIDDIQSKLKSDFSADLKGLLTPTRPVPQSIDEKILNLAQKKLGTKRQYKLLRWLAPVAAAAAIIIAVMLWPPQTQNLSHEPRLIEDIDRSGTVDILDAMKLDREIKNATASPDYDFNKDGLVDKKDVETVAYVAVRINKGV